MTKTTSKDDESIVGGNKDLPFSSLNPPIGKWGHNGFFAPTF